MSQFDLTVRAPLVFSVFPSVVAIGVAAAADVVVVVVVSAAVAVVSMYTNK